jgi:CheY-like chemotaxis protein
LAIPPVNAQLTPSESNRRTEVAALFGEPPQGIVEMEKMAAPEVSNSDRGRRVLIVDDNVALAENIAEILALTGYIGEIAASAEEAIPRALSGNITFIITDFRLPGLNGVQLIQRLRGQGRDFHAVLISAYSDEGTLSAARDAGVDDFIPKPLDFARLTETLGRLAS